MPSAAPQLCKQTLEAGRPQGRGSGGAEAPVPLASRPFLPLCFHIEWGKLRGRPRKVKANLQGQR